MSINKSEEDLLLQFITERIEKWESIRKKKFKEGDVRIPVITVSIEPGSGGSIVAQGVAARLGLDIFHREMVQEVAQSVHISPEVVESIEKERLSGIEDFVSSLIKDQYLWPGLYLEHLERVVNAIGKVGGAVIVGRGANFILASEEKLSLRIVAPFETRVQNVADTYNVSVEEARRRVSNRESKRKAFIKKSFHADIADPLHYDFIINTGNVSIEDAVEAVSLYWGNKHLGSIK